MIDFACKKFDINEIIRCGFGLTRAEFRILRYFISNRHNYLKTQDFSKTLGFELSTVQRAVKKLHSLNLLERSQINLSSGGYIYQYKVKNKSEIKKRIFELLSNWNKRVEIEFDNW